jgi:hypothetical protein
VEAEVEEILEITARLSAEIQRRRGNIAFARQHFGRRHDDDGIIAILDAAEKDTDELQDLVNQAHEHCMETSQ